ncbi:PhzF family phenazine biosynthesis protein [Halodesulfovibrio marinisediminis]|uniref:Phenazine biosynthesis protein PhzF family n=1 Tax=Halodesulfovibrio marinisediminis DSM 17456 TaxID=1121457 RepID=A0A1N6E8X2_9BACT|nr:PhzF family phenazine biosynthesis protein [Halodesulfovibrio marinisediminis]SIN79484.1 phenazine biosynthesis protein PhzF family [Halodesulfovibrio marinisediminis DSM 17456]
MRLPIFQVDAFTDSIFGGNSAVVCELPHWLPDDVMQKIAIENAVAETAFFRAADNGFEIRWFTPEIEIDLCGHATLATAHVIARHLQPSLTSLIFYSQSGQLAVTVDGELLTLNFPSRKPIPSSAPQIILDSIQVEPIEVLKSRDYVLVFENERTIRNMTPDQNLLNSINLGTGGIAVTAKGDEVDFVSRFFTPQASIFEDPVTGSAHCSLIPYWSEKLSKDSMIAVQASPRTGILYCKNLNERVLISGKAVTYLEGHIMI